MNNHPFKFGSFPRQKQALSASALSASALTVTKPKPKPNVGKLFFFLPYGQFTNLNGFPFPPINNSSN